MQNAVGISGRHRNVLDGGFEQRPQVLRVVFHFDLGNARPGIAVEHGKIELVFGGVQVDEQVVDLVQDFRHARVRPVDLVDHYDGRQMRLERLHQNIARLRQRTFAGIHQQHDAIDNFERALHFATEIAMPWRIHNVDLDAAVANARNLG